MLAIYLGHGSFSVIVAGAHILIDPVLTDSFMEGLAAPMPLRQIDIDALPPVDAVVITHSHVGHLEPESICLLPRHIPIFHPDDPIINAVLEGMGFKAAKVVGPGQSVTFGHGRLIFTSAGPIRPFVGVLLQDTDGVAWYMGDRGDMESPHDIERLAESVGGIDLLIPSHPSDMHSFFVNSTWDGGGQADETHGEWLRRCIETVIRINPRLFVPASTNFSYMGRAEWLNRYMFPMKPEEFVNIVRSYAPGIDGRTLTPGDAIELIDRRPCVLPQEAAHFILAHLTPEGRGLDPTDPPPSLTDPTIAADCPEYPELLRQIEDYLLTSLIPWVESPSEQYRSTIAAYRSLKLSYRLTIVSGDGTSQGWRLSFSDGAVAIERVTANDVPRYGDIHTRIAASTLYRWIRNEIPYFMADFDCRRAGAVWDLGYTTAGSIVAKGMQSTCLVTAHLTADSRPLEAWYRKKVGDLNRNNDSEARRAS